MKLPFSKMQGLGNDFVVIDATRTNYSLTKSQIQQMADRHYGIGFDQLLLLEKATRPDVDFTYRIFNADGSEVSQCGNGARCIAHYIKNHSLSMKQHFLLATQAGKLELQIEPNNEVTVNMGIPTFEPEQIPFRVEKMADRYQLPVAGEQITLSTVNVGNPHAVIEVNDVNAAPVQQLGALIEQHPLFPERTNVGFMQILSSKEIRLRVFERGAGETLACGSGACAAVVVGRKLNLLAEKVLVHLPGGDLTICWQGPNKPVWMTGPAEEVFLGEYLT
jgi:diaminopimelate epimerase